MGNCVLQSRIVTFARRPADELLLRTGRGDGRAFEELYYRLLPAVVAFVRSRVSPAAPLDDLVQEVFFRVWEQRERFCGRSSARTYVLGLALNVIHEYRRDGRSAVLSLERLDLPDPRVEQSGHEFQRRESLELLSRARQALTARQSAAVRLVYDEGLTPRQAAEMLDCSERAIRDRLKKALQKLRICLTDPTHDPGRGVETGEPPEDIR